MYCVTRWTLKYSRNGNIDYLDWEQLMDQIHNTKKLQDNYWNIYGVHAVVHVIYYRVCRYRNPSVIDRYGFRKPDIIFYTP